MSDVRSGGDRDSTLLILLVGANPLPNYLSACALRPGKLALVHTPETSAARDRLKSSLQGRFSAAVRFVEPDPQVADATCSTTVRRVIEGLLSGDGDAWLNYTGGTKVMAAHAHIAHARSGGKPEHASYLDEGGKGQSPRLRFDDGTSTPLSEYPAVQLELQTILQLHGLTHKPRTPREPAPTDADVLAILSRVLDDVSLAEKLHKERKRLEKLKQAGAENPFEARKFGLDLSQPQVPSAEMTAKAYKQWTKFIGGEWLEEWVGAQIRQVGLDPTAEITVGFDAWRGSKKAQVEIDVAAVRGHRSYFVSCTTDTTKGLCKSKLFEVAVRSRQLGGDLARAALVCLAEDQTVAKLQAEIDDLWGASNTTRVFGLSDVTEWSDHGGKEPNRHSLEEWLENL